jgi:hypothetical protein
MDYALDAATRRRIDDVIKAQPSLELVPSQAFIDFVRNLLRDLHVEDAYDVLREDEGLL